MESRPRRAAAALSWAFLIAAGGARAAEEEPPAAPASDAEADIVRPAEIVVTATRTAVDPERLPYVSHTVEEERLRTERSPRSLPQALVELPSVMVQQTAQGQESPFLRGFTGFRTLLLVDGIRINNSTFREGPNQYWGLVDPLAIGRIEAVMGPSSVLYGSDAIGGTVNAITLEDFASGFHPGVYYRYASAEDSHTVRGDARGRAGERLSYTGGVTWRDLGDVSGGRDIGEQPHTGFEALSGDAKIVHDVSRRLKLTAVFQAMDHFDVPRTHSTIHAVSFHGTTVGTDIQRDLDQERRFVYLRSEWMPEADWLEKLEFTVSYQGWSEEEERITGAGVTQDQGFDVHTAGIGAVATSPSPVGTWTYGVEYYGDCVEDSFRVDRNPDGTINQVRPRGPVANDARYDLLGAFIQDEVKPIDRLSLILGGRYNHARARADGEDIDTSSTDALTFEDLDESWDTLVGSGRMIVEATENLSPFAGISQGFRAPNLSDLTRFDIARSGEQEIPATNLDPEYYTSFEGGLRGRWASWGFTAAYYYTDIRDMIVRFPTGDTTPAGNAIVTKDNIGDGYVQGVDLFADWSFHPGFTLFGNFSWTDGKVENLVSLTEKSSEPISRLPPVAFLLGLRWTSENGRAWIEGTGRLVLEQDRLSPDDERDTERIPPGGTPGYYLLGLRGGVRLTERITLFAGVENITDQDYRVHGSGVTSPGTSFVGGTEVRF
jgi:hemoglobin/transferrin/lactoferrin receptor protein